MNKQIDSSPSATVAAVSSIIGAIGAAVVPMALAIGVGAAAIAATPGEAQAQSWDSGYHVPHGSQPIGERDIFGRQIFVTPGPLF